MRERVSNSKIHKWRREGGGWNERIRGATTRHYALLLLFLSSASASVS